MIPIIFKRRGGGSGLVNFAPNLEANTSVWWKADDATTITQSGGLVSNLADKRLNVDLFQDTATAQPSTGIETINGKNTLTFTEVEDSLISNGQSVIREGSNIAVHCVLDVPINGTNLVRIIQVVTGGTGSTGIVVQRAFVDGLRIQTYQNGTITNYNIDPFFDGLPHVFSFCFYSSDNLVEVYKDGSLVQDFVLPAGTLDGASIVNNFMNIGGKFGEMFIVSNKARQISDIEIAHGYLAHEWGLQANLPISHPYKEARPQIAFTPTTYTYFGTYGQSWVARNGNNGANTTLQAPQSNDIFCPEPTNAFLEGIINDMLSPKRFIPAYETDPQVQSLTYPMALKYRADLGSGTYLVRHSGEGSKSLEELAKPTMSFYDGVSPFYQDMLNSWNFLKQRAASNGDVINHKYMIWAQGLDNLADSLVVYKPKHNEMLDGIKADALATFGNSPKYLIIPQPGGTGSGAHENILAQTENALERADSIAAYAGYAIEKHSDFLHFSTNGNIDTAEILALKSRLWDNGTKWHSPYFTNARLVGTTIILDVQGIYDVVADETVANMCHWDGGSLVNGVYTGGAPIANLGFEFDGSATIFSVFVEPRNIYIELSAAVSGTLRYAYTNTLRLDGFTLNRGNVRSTWNNNGAITSAYTGNVLYDWALSGQWQVSV